MRRIIIAALIAISVSGCGFIPNSDKSVLVGGTSLTAKVELINDETAAGLETAYGVAVQAALAYRRLPRCARGTFATWENPCSTANGIRTLQAADRKAYSALQKLRVVHASGGINALDALRLAREAIGELKGLVAFYKGETA